jgi:uncharacterized protein with HEPN domain
MLERIAMIEQFTMEGRGAFMQSVKTQEAVIRCYEVLGEIVKRLSPKLLAPTPLSPGGRLLVFATS